MEPVLLSEQHAKNPHELIKEKKLKENQQHLEVLLFQNHQYTANTTTKRI